jgi:hypothetical protein
MGALPGAKYTLMRTISMILNLVGVILLLVFTGVAIDNASDNMILILMPILAAIAFSILIKVEIDFVDDHRPVLLLATVIITLVVQIMIALLAVDVSAARTFGLYVPLLGAVFCMVICWHYTLAIYKNEKKRFLLGFVGFEILFVGFAYEFIGLLTLIAGILVAAAVVMDLVAEKILIGKKLLNYI